MNRSHLMTAAFAFSTAALLTFCANNTATEQEGDDGSKPVELIMVEAYASETDCDTAVAECALAHFRLPVLTGGTPKVTEQINSDAEAVIREHIKSRLPEPMAMGTYSELASAFVEGYSLFANEFPDNPAKWFFEINGDSSVVSADYFVLRLRIEEFMGGAHPNSFTLLQNYRLSDGEPVDVRDVFDEADLRVRAEVAFRQKHGLEAEQSLNDAGFMFEDGTFVLPENMAITSDGLLLIYNPYEVASYAAGYTVLRLKMEGKEPA